MATIVGVVRKCHVDTLLHRGVGGAWVPVDVVRATTSTQWSPKSFAATLAIILAVSAAPALVAMDYACNPVHSYPNGALCVSTNGPPSLVTPASATTSYACNPSHSHLGGLLPLEQSCLEPSHSYSGQAVAASAVTSAAVSAATAVGVAGPDSNPRKIDGMTWSVEYSSCYSFDNTLCDLRTDQTTSKLVYCTSDGVAGRQITTNDSR